MSQRLPEDLRRIVLALTALEDSTLFILMGALTGGNPIARVVIGMVVAVAAVRLLKHFIALMPRGYQLVASLASSFGLAALLGLLGLSPSLGAFVAGYAYGSVARVSYTTAGELIFMLYAVTAPPIILPLMMHAQLGAHTLAFIAMVSVAAVFLRFIAVFLAAFTVTRNFAASIYMGIAMASISELSYLVVAYASPISEIALVAALLPVASMLIAPIIATRITRFATRIGLDRTVLVIRPVRREIISLMVIARIHVAALAPSLSTEALSVLVLAASLIVIILDVTHLWDRSRGLAVLLTASASTLGLFTSWLAGRWISVAAFSLILAILPALIAVARLPRKT